MLDLIPEISTGISQTSFRDSMYTLEGIHQL